MTASGPEGGLAALLRPYWEQRLKTGAAQGTKPPAPQDKTKQG